MSSNAKWKFTNIVKFPAKVILIEIHVDSKSLDVS